ncbi:MAG: adenylyl-sulfate kinase, partial [Eubacteriales bacterium]
AGSKKDSIERHDVAEVIITAQKPIAYDLSSEEASSSRFVIVDGYEIAGGGIVTAEIADNMSDTRELVMRRNLKWEGSAITPAERAARYSQRAAMIIITGNRAVGKKDIARRVERMLFDMGRSVYFLGIGNVLYGVVADIKTTGEVPAHDEHIRRLGEVSNIMLDAGMILLVTAAELTAHDIEVLGTTVEPERIRTLWLGDRVTTDIKVDRQISEVSDVGCAARAVKSYIEDEGMIFKA